MIYTMYIYIIYIHTYIHTLYRHYIYHIYHIDFSDFPVMWRLASRRTPSRFGSTASDRVKLETWLGWLDSMDSEVMKPGWLENHLCTYIYMYTHVYRYKWWIFQQGPVWLAEAIQWQLQVPKLEVPAIYKAYVRGYTSKIWLYMVRYLHFRILKFPLTRSHRKIVTYWIIQVWGHFITQIAT